MDLRLGLLGNQKLDIDLLGMIVSPLLFLESRNFRFSQRPRLESRDQADTLPSQRRQLSGSSTPAAINRWQPLRGPPMTQASWNRWSRMISTTTSRSLTPTQIPLLTQQATFGPTGLSSKLPGHPFPSQHTER